MKHIKLFEDFKINNNTGELIKKEDIIECIKNKGVIYSNIVINKANNDPDKPLIPTSIDEDGLITVNYDNKLYSVNIKDVNKIEF
jgi:hypothetical protein